VETMTDLQLSDLYEGRSSFAF